MQNVYSYYQWLALFPDRRALFRLPGVSIWTVQCDYMHTKYLGTDQYFFGSVLRVMVYLLLPGSPDDNLGVVWRAIEIYYTQNDTPCRYSCITLRMFAFADTGYPKLKGKAGEIRHLGHALHDIRLASMDIADEFHRNIELALRASCQMELLLGQTFWPICIPAGRCCIVFGMDLHLLPGAIENGKLQAAAAFSDHDETSLSNPLCFSSRVLKPEVGLVLPRRRLYELYAGCKPFLPSRNTETFGVQKNHNQDYSGIALSDDGHQTEWMTSMPSLSCNEDLS